jgi:multidrug efflux pump subunit AcrA (membrane-fusion protein)
VQQVRLNQASVLAPDDGVISARTATVGAVVGAGTELFRMIRKGRLEWRAEVTSAELARVTRRHDGASHCRQRRATGRPRAHDRPHGGSADAQGAGLCR